MSQTDNPALKTRARHHFFVDPTALAAGEIQFSAEQEHQITRVLRLKTGDSVIVLDGLGREAEARLSVEKRRLQASVAGPSTQCSEPSLQLIVYQAMIRPEHFAWLLQKGTEVGVHAFVPLQTARSQHGGAGSPARQHRLRTIVREAAEQSRRLVVPDLGQPRPFAAVLEEFQTARRRGAAGTGLLLWEGEGEQRLTQALRPRLRAGSSVHLLVGPEGGWTTQEVTMARAAGLEPLSLGPRLLRAETAALVAATGLLALSGDLL